MLDRSVFYGESGGQAGDTGVIKTESALFEVTATGKTADGNILHVGRIVDGDGISIGDKIKAEINVKAREAAARNHTAAHLLQAALREKLGTHVEQAGQLVNSNEVRFDFTHFSALTAEELHDIEQRVNEIILSALPVTSVEMPIAEAKKLGAMLSSARNTATSSESSERATSPPSFAAAPMSIIQANSASSR